MDRSPVTAAGDSESDAGPVTLHYITWTRTLCGCGLDWLGWPSVRPCPLIASCWAPYAATTPFCIHFTGRGGRTRGPHSARSRHVVH
jgi:hypothetical protein